MNIDKILAQCDTIDEAVEIIRRECARVPPPEPDDGDIDRAAILAAVEASPVPGITWKDRGVAPIGYANGMGIAYGLVFQAWLNGSPHAIAMARARTDDDDGDALCWYNSNFRNLGMSNEEDGQDTLRHLFVLMYGLGMRESSGKFCEGRDQSATNTSADTAEAGLFQTSYDARYGCSEIAELLQSYKAQPDDPEQVGPIFHEGVSCSTEDLANYGSGDGERWQYYSKAGSPMLGIWGAGVGMRTIGGANGHWGPLRRKEVELKSQVDALLQEIEQIVEGGAVA